MQKIKKNISDIINTIAPEHLEINFKNIKRL